MDSTTQQNAALVEQSSAAADSLEDQAATLTQAVSVFRLADNRNMQHAPAANALRRPTLPPVQNKSSQENWETF